MSSKSPRRVVMETLRDLARKVRNGRYFAKRGAIDWSSFDFDAHPRAISLQVDEGMLLPSRSGEGFPLEGMRRAKIALEAFTRIPKATEPPEIDDGLMDELLDDIEQIVTDLERARDSGDFPVAFRVDWHSAAFAESHDVGLRIQGAVATLLVDY